MINAVRKISWAWLAVLAACLTFASCSNDDDNTIDVDYSQDILGIWYHASGEYEEILRFKPDGTFDAMGSDAEDVFYKQGNWALKKNRLAMTTTEGEAYFNGTVSVFPKDVMQMTDSKTGKTRIFHYQELEAFPARLVGTWTCMEAGYAEALTIHSDGTLESTGLEDGRYWEGLTGRFMDGEGDFGIELNGEYRWGTYEVVSGELLVLTDRDTNVRRTYRYSQEELSEEIIGMWQAHNADGSQVVVQSYNENGTADNISYLNAYGQQHCVFGSGTHKLVGDLLFQTTVYEDGLSTTASRITYTPDGSSLGDVLTYKFILMIDDNPWENVITYTRAKQPLNLSGQQFDYASLFIADVAGLDKEMEFMGYTLNFAQMDGSKLDMMLKATLFHAEFPDANTISYAYHLNGNKETYNAPIVAEGNKITVKMSQRVPTLKDVEFCTFRSMNDSQLHLCMSREQFVNFYTNMQAILKASQDEQFNINDAAAIDAIHNSISEAVESVNLSIVLKAEK